MTTVKVVVINESLDSAIERRPVFHWQDINILIFYCFPKPFNPDIVFRLTAAIHADPHLRALSTGIKPCLASELTILVRVDDLR